VQQGATRTSCESSLPARGPRLKKFQSIGNEQLARPIVVLDARPFAMFTGRWDLPQVQQSDFFLRELQALAAPRLHLNPVIRYSLCRMQGCGGHELK
jgi:hypothetical protein